MANSSMLAGVKNALGIQGNYLDSTLNQYIDEVIDYLTEAGVKSAYITTGIVSRGVSDLWNYGAGEGKLSEYFLQRATQLSYKK